MAGLRQNLRAIAARLSTLRPSRTKGFFPMLWLSDSIFNMDELEAATETALSSLYEADSFRGTYGGTTAGAALLEVADTTYAYLNGTWTSCTRGTPFSHFRALVFEFGRNDAFDAESAANYRKAYDKILAQGLTYFRQVVTSNCPPRALADLTGWDLGNDLFDTLGHRTQCAAVATKWGHRHYDLYSDFLAQVSGATYTVAQLMRDTFHPTYTTGASLIATKLAAKLLDLTPANSVSPEVSGQVVNYLFGQPTVGSWSFVSTANVVGPNQGPVPRIANLDDQGLQISASGAKVTFPATRAEQIWVHYYRKTSGGTATVYIDRGTGSQVSFNINTSNAYNNYPQSYLVAGGLSASTHAVEIETTSANPVCILGITAVGA